MRNEPTDPNSRARDRFWLVLLFAVAALARIGWLWVRTSGEIWTTMLVFPDEQAYWQTARSLALGAGQVDELGFRATYMPVYPAFLSLFAHSERLSGWAVLVQLLIAACIAPLTFLLAKRWVHLRESGPPPAVSAPGSLAILAGLAVALDPFLIFFSGLILTESIFAVLLVATWVLVLPMVQHSRPIEMGQGLRAGVLLLACLSIRPSAVILVLLAPLGVLGCRRFDRASRRWALLVVAVVLIGLSPWAARNKQKIGAWCWLTTRGGISFYDGVREGADGSSDLAHTRSLPELAGLTEIEWDRYFRDQSWSAIRRDPMRVLRLGWPKFQRTWSLTPNVEAYRHGVAALVSATWMVIVLAAAAIGWAIHRRAIPHWVVLMLPVVGFTLLHTVFVGSVRYRVPVMPLLMVLSAAGLIGIMDRLRPGRDRRQVTTTVAPGVTD